MVARWRSGVHDLPVAEALWRLLDTDDVAIDVGANLGYTASLMARRVGRAGSVICFEPHPEVFRELQENMLLVRRDSGVGQIETHEIALSSQSGEATLLCGEEFHQNRESGRVVDSTPQATSARHFTVATRRLDGIIGERTIALAKIDVEGHELAVLRGAQQTLASGRLEHIVYEDFGGRESLVHQFLGDFGYTVYGLGWALHQPVLTDADQDPAIDRAWESPNYLATRSAEKVRKRFRRWGWSVI